jgi:hypothetical protein
LIKLERFSLSFVPWSVSIGGKVRRTLANFRDGQNSSDAKTISIKLLVVCAFAIWGCSSSAPLSITMEHPETKQTLVCAAKNQLARTDTGVLANAVESCARNLESRGFVRKR